MGSAVRFATREEGNPFAPLPPDYPQLSEEGQRLARLNACCLQETPLDMVNAWNFFRRTYLFPLPAGTFYGSDLTESPRTHYQIIHSIGSHALNCWACPRGFGKSTIIDEFLLLTALSRPGFVSGLCLASDDMVNERFTIYMAQLSDNEMIVSDWGNMKPSRGEGKVWNQHLLTLANGSRLRGFAVLGRKRGIRPRPRLLVLDDPEYDPSGSTDTHKLRTDFERLLFRVLLNMGETGMSMLWTGTMITKQGSLWNAASGDDPRFKRWHRNIVGAYSVGPDGLRTPTWDSLMGEAWLANKKEEIGSAAFAAEYLNEPGVGVESTFTIDPETNLYFVDGDHAASPLTATAPCSFRATAKGSKEAIKTTKPFGEVASSLFRIMTVDYAPTVGPQSDYSAIVVMGFQQPADVLWVLDLFIGRLKDEQLCRQIYKMGRKWLPRVVGIEAVTIQQRLPEMVASYIEEVGTEGAWLPKVMPVKYPASVSKQDRIGGMQWRFNTGRIKLPGHYRQISPWRMLYQQIEEFQAEAMDGNLQHDDAIDALCMYQQVARSKGTASHDSPAELPTPLSRLYQGQRNDPLTGLPLISGLEMNDIPPDLMRKMIMMDDPHAQRPNRLARNLNVGLTTPYGDL